MGKLELHEIGSDIESAKQNLDCFRVDDVRGVFSHNGTIVAVVWHPLDRHEKQPTRVGGLGG